MHRIGIDLGGTKIEGALLDDAGRIVNRLRRPTPRAYDATLEAIAELSNALEAGFAERATVGVGIPGALEPSTGLVKNANRSEEHTSELQSHSFISYAVFCLKKN